MGVFYNSEIKNIYYGNKRVTRGVTKDDVFYLSDYPEPTSCLNIVAEEEEVTICLQNVYFPTVPVLYSVNGGKWKAYHEDSVVLSNIGDRVAFWNMKEELNKTDTTTYANFSFNKKCRTEGNIASLLNFSDTIPKKGFMRLFADCTHLTTTTSLPFRDLTDSCYCGMFYGCTSLEYINSTMFSRVSSLAPSCCEGMFHGCTKLGVARFPTVSVLAESCFKSMFRRCTSLISIEPLTAQELPKFCYYAMFAGCTSLRTLTGSSFEFGAVIVGVQSCAFMFEDCTELIDAPNLNFISVADAGCAEMFSRCYSLSSVHVSFSEWFAETDAFDGWMRGVQDVGSFYKPSALPEEYGIDYIPEGWTVVNID